MKKSVPTGLVSANVVVWPKEPQLTLASMHSTLPSPLITDPVATRSSSAELFVVHGAAPDAGSVNVVRPETGSMYSSRSPLVNEKLVSSPTVLNVPDPWNRAYKL